MGRLARMDKAQAQKIVNFKIKIKAFSDDKWNGILKVSLDKKFSYINIINN